MVDSGKSYCIDHQRQKDRDYSKTRGSSPYNNRAWMVYRVWYLKRHRLCVECAKEGKTVVATEVDHIVPLSKGGDFWEPSNHCAMCKPCHSRKTAKEGGFGK